MHFAVCMAGPFCRPALHRRSSNRERQKNIVWPTKTYWRQSRDISLRPKWPRVEAEVPNAPATACSSLSWVDGWRTVLCLAAERVLFCTFSHLGFILHARYAWSIGDDASRYSAPDPGILPLHGPLHSRLESVLLLLPAICYLPVPQWLLLYKMTTFIV